MDFSEAVKAQHEGRVVRRGRLVWLDFLSGPIGLWNGYGRLKTKDGREWLGLGGFGSVSGVAQAIDGSAPEIKLTLSGVDETFAAKAKAEAPEYYNRGAMVFSQYFDAGWQCLDLPYAVSWGMMRKLTAAKQSDEGGFTRTVTVSVETPLAGKKRPKFAYVTAADHLSRHPGDRIAERTAGIDSKLVTFPDY